MAARSSQNLASCSRATARAWRSEASASAKSHGEPQERFGPEAMQLRFKPPLLRSVDNPQRLGQQIPRLGWISPLECECLLASPKERVPG